MVAKIIPTVDFLPDARYNKGNARSGLYGTDGYMQTCPHPDILIAYSEGRIFGKHRSALYHHVAGCARCRKTLQILFDVSGEAENASGREAATIYEAAKKRAHAYHTGHLKMRESRDPERYGTRRHPRWPSLIELPERERRKIWQAYRAYRQKRAHRDTVSDD